MEYGDLQLVELLENFGHTRTKSAESRFLFVELRKNKP